jgi:hypothetical protein
MMWIFGIGLATALGVALLPQAPAEAHARSEISKTYAGNVRGVKSGSGKLKAKGGQSKASGGGEDS